MPGDVAAQLDLANRLGWLADAKRVAGHRTDALHLRRQQLDIVESVLSLQRNNAQVREAHLLALIGMAATALEGGQQTVARTTVRQAREAVNALRRHDSANTDWASWEGQVAQLEAKLDLPPS